MANTTQSNYMLLPVPIPSTDPGPTYAFDLNTCLLLIDQHNHSSGQGIPINPTGININSDLSFGANNATNLRSSRYSVQNGTLSGALDLNCTYVNGGNLYYNDSLGNKIQVTANGGIAGTPGSITGLVAPASVNFLSGPGTFQFLSSSATAGNIDAASYILRRQVAGSQSITIQAPNSLSSSYTFSPSSGLPASSAFMTMTASGQIGYASQTPPASIQSVIVLDTPTGYGSLNPVIRRYQNVGTTGSAFTYVNSTTGGSYITINEIGTYYGVTTDASSATAFNTGVSLNSTELTTAINAISKDTRLTIGGANGNGTFTSPSFSRKLNVGDIVRVHGDSNASPSAGSLPAAIFSMIKVNT